MLMVSLLGRGGIVAKVIPMHLAQELTVVLREVGERHMMPKIIFPAVDENELRGFAQLENAPGKITTIHSHFHPGASSWNILIKSSRLPVIKYIDYSTRSSSRGATKSCIGHRRRNIILINSFGQPSEPDLAMDADLRVTGG